MSAINTQAQIEQSIATAEDDGDRQALLAMICTEDPKQYWVTYFYITINSLIEGMPFDQPISPEFATKELAIKAGEIAKIYYSECYLQERTYLFAREDAPGREGILSNLVTNFSASDALDFFPTESEKMILYYKEMIASTLPPTLHQEAEV